MGFALHVWANRDRMMVAEADILAIRRVLVARIGCCRFGFFVGVAAPINTCYYTHSNVLKSSVDHGFLWE
jgi:hypothetical protein